MNRKTLVIILVIVLCILCTIVSGVVAFFAYTSANIAKDLSSNSNKITNNNGNTGSTSTPPAAPRSDLQTYSNIDKGISFQYPTTWDKEENQSGLVVQVYSPLENSGDTFRERVNFVVGDDANQLDIDYTTDALVSEYKNRFTDFNLISRDTINVNGISARKLTYTLTLNGSSQKQSQIYFQNNKKNYFITFIATPSTYDKYVNDFQTIVDTTVIK